MIRAALRVLGVLAGLALVQAGTAAGQIDYRVNRGDELGTGRALDRNPGLGTGGFNQPASTFDYGMRSNSIVTGNITGLARFHGSTPVLQNNQFRAGLPSAGLSGFLARSVSAEDVLTNRVSTPTYYMDTQRTMPDLGYIQRGLTTPGSSTLISPYTRPVYAQTPDTRQKLPDLPLATDHRLQIGGPSSGFGVYQQETVPVPKGDPLTAVISPFSLATSSSIFGMPSPPPSAMADTSDTARWLETRRASSLSREDQASANGKASEDETGWPRSDGVPTRAEAIDDGLHPGPGVVSPGQAETAFGVYQRQIGGRTAEGTPPSVAVGAEQTTPAAPGQRPRDLGQDLFTDMCRAIQAAEQLGVQDFRFQPVAPTGRQPTEEARPGKAGAEPSEGGRAEVLRRAAESGRRSDRALAELATAAKWAKDLLDDPVTSFVGKFASKFNDCMAKAEEALKAGQFYRAAQHYELAHTIDPRNPLPLLGRGHALLAAGDYMTAAASLQRGLQRFPQIAAFRLDLLGLVGQRDVFDVRRADLERRLATSEQYELRFLLGYVELYSGLPELGLRDLERAAELAPEGSVIAVFPDLLRGRRSLLPAAAKRQPMPTP